MNAQGVFVYRTEDDASTTRWRDTTRVKLSRSCRERRGFQETRSLYRLGCLWSTGASQVEARVAGQELSERGGGCGDGDDVPRTARSRHASRFPETRQPGKERRTEKMRAIRNSIDLPVEELLGCEGDGRGFGAGGKSWEEGTATFIVGDFAGLDTRSTQAVR